MVNKVSWKKERLLLIPSIGHESSSPWTTEGRKWTVHSYSQQQKQLTNLLYKSSLIITNLIVFLCGGVEVVFMAHERESRGVICTLAQDLKGFLGQKFPGILHFPISSGLSSCEECWVHRGCGCHKPYVLVHEVHI